MPVNPTHATVAHYRNLRNWAFCGTRNPIRDTTDVRLVTCKKCLKGLKSLPPHLREQAESR